MRTGAGLLLLVGPNLIVSQRHRSLLSEMLAFTSSLGSRFQMPLQTTMAELSVEGPGDRPDAKWESAVLNLADLAVSLRREPTLGICLQRSLTRYYFLRRVGLPVQVHFGIQTTKRPDAKRIVGHAWLTLDGEDYWEDGGQARDFTIMLSFPADALGAN